jgi:predicted NodU family carbamoyl transferase
MQAAQLKLLDAAELCRRTALAIVDGKVIGWFQGRMEWGPRALGNRSILADPRRADMKELLNLKIKRCESFRPFAPSVLVTANPALMWTARAVCKPCTNAPIRSNILLSTPSAN